MLAGAVQSVDIDRFAALARGAVTREASSAPRGRA
jgi:hypothetical protein